MTELSLHILDIAQNSIVAGATLITVQVSEQEADDCLWFSITDNGKGMSPEFLAQVTDPFVTTRTTRKVGMGISLLKSAAEATGGHIELDSKEGEGTSIKAVFSYHHIDRQPLGDMAGTMQALISLNPGIDFVYRHTVGNEVFLADTREMREALGGVPLDQPEVVSWLGEYLQEGISQMNGGLS